MAGGGTGEELPDSGSISSGSCLGGGEDGGGGGEFDAEMMSVVVALGDEPLASVPRGCNGHQEGAPKRSEDKEARCCSP